MTRSVDRTTFHDFYEETASGLRAYLRSACRNTALADDCLQETYLRLLRRRLPELDIAQRKAYLYKTAHSVLSDHYRARRREARWNDKQLSPEGPECAGLGGMAGLEHGPVLHPLELPVDMRRVFDTLNARQQSLLWLAYVEGFKHDEIAEIVGVNAGSVKVLLSRARAELAARLSAQGLAPHAGHGVTK